MQEGLPQMPVTKIKFIRALVGYNAADYTLSDDSKKETNVFYVNEVMIYRTKL
jgi:hypothetical protein